MPNLNAAWVYGEWDDKNGPRQVLNMFITADDLALSFKLCQVAAKVAKEYGLENDIQLSADPLKAQITLHLYEPGDLTNDHFAAAWEISEAVALKFSN